MAAFYTEDALFLPATHDMGVTNHNLELIEAHGDGNMLFGAAKWSADGKDTSGADQPWDGVATHIFERQDDGSLKLQLHTFN